MGTRSADKLLVVTLSKGMLIMTKNTEEYYTLTFKIPVNQMGVSKDGLWFNLPYRVDGELKHGAKRSKIMINKGRVLAPTAKGRDEYGKTAKATAKPAVDVSNLM